MLSNTFHLRFFTISFGAAGGVVIHEVDVDGKLNIPSVNLDRIRNLKFQIYLSYLILIT